MRELTEGQGRTIEAYSKAFAVFAGVLAAAWTIWTYTHELQKERDTKEQAGRSLALQARQPFEAERLRFYEQAVTIAGVLPVSEPEIRKKAEADFWKLYWGPMVLVEDDEVARAMIELGRCIKDPQCAERETLSLRLGRSCRSSLASVWDVYLPDVSKDKLERLRH